MGFCLWNLWLRLYVSTILVPEAGGVLGTRMRPRRRFKASPKRRGWLVETAQRLCAPLFRIISFHCHFARNKRPWHVPGWMQSQLLSKQVPWYFFPAVSSPLCYAAAWKLSHCDCLISHRCRCLCYITGLPDSLGDKLLPKKPSRCELRCTDAMGELKEFRGDWIVYSSVLSFTFPLGRGASFMSAWLFLGPNLEMTNGAHGGSLPLNDTVNIKKID